MLVALLNLSQVCGDSDFSNLSRCCVDIAVAEQQCYAEHGEGSNVCDKLQNSRKGCYSVLDVFGRAGGRDSSMILTDYCYDLAKFERDCRLSNHSDCDHYTRDRKNCYKFEEKVISGYSKDRCYGLNKNPIASSYGISELCVDLAMDKHDCRLGGTLKCSDASWNSRMCYNIKDILDNVNRSVPPKMNYSTTLSQNISQKIGVSNCECESSPVWCPGSTNNLGRGNCTTGWECGVKDKNGIVTCTNVTKPILDEEYSTINWHNKNICKCMPKPSPSPTFSSSPIPSPTVNTTPTASPRRTHRKSS